SPATALSLETSSATARCPAPVSPATTSCAAASDRSAASTAKPSSASRAQTDLPMPPAAPVTSTIPFISRVPSVVVADVMNTLSAVVQNIFCADPRVWIHFLPNHRERRIFLTEPHTSTELAMRKLREAILSGELLPNDKLHQDRLAEMLGISRTPLRAALTTLAQTGLVTYESNRGFAVREFSFEDRKSVV